MGDLNWVRISLVFPEFERNFVWKSYEDHPMFGKNPVNFLFRKEYGAQLFLEGIPGWIPVEETRVGERTLDEYYSQLSRQVYLSVVAELDKSFETLESWRAFVIKYNEGHWTGNLSDHLDFVNLSRVITLGDYYSYHQSGSNKSNSPTGRLIKIKNLPKWVSNGKLTKYRELAEYVVESESPNSCNSILGESISECVRRAGEIYQVARELEELEL